MVCPWEEKPDLWGRLTATTPSGTLLAMAPPPDLSGPLKAAALAFQLAAGDPAPCDIGSGPQIVNSARPRTSFHLTVGTSTPYAPGSAHRAGHGHEHPLHAFGSRAVATTSAPATDYVIVEPDHAEYVKDAASAKIIDDLVFVAQQLDSEVARRTSSRSAVSPSLVGSRPLSSLGKKTSISTSSRR